VGELESLLADGALLGRKTHGFEEKGDSQKKEQFEKDPGE
jgi:hypothetical protein